MLQYRQVKWKKCWEDRDSFNWVSDIIFNVALKGFIKLYGFLRIGYVEVGLVFAFVIGWLISVW